MGRGVLKSLPELRFGQSTFLLFSFFYLIYLVVTVSRLLLTGHKTPAAHRTIQVDLTQLCGVTAIGWLLRCPWICWGLSGLLGWAPGLGSSVPYASPPAPISILSRGRTRGKQKHTPSLEVQVGNYMLFLLPYYIGQSKSHDECQIQEIRNKIHKVAWQRAWITREGRLGALI